LEVEEFDDVIGGYRAVFWAHAYEGGEVADVAVYFCQE
jgi:hypothetical protein